MLTLHDLRSAADMDTVVSLIVKGTDIGDGFVIYLNNKIVHTTNRDKVRVF